MLLDRLKNKLRRVFGIRPFDPRGLSVEEAFSQVYKKAVWGSGRGTFYSGRGSDEELSAVYIRAVREFARQHGVKSILDLGCGDFRVGSQLIDPELIYIGVDVVKAIIDHHNEAHASERVLFVHADIITDDLPQAELCLIRQVLQHLSNDQIASTLKKVQKYKYVLVTEHIPPLGAPGFTANLDMHHGPDIRLHNGSFVQLDLPPFRQKISRILCEVYLPDQSRLQTVVIEN